VLVSTTLTRRVRAPSWTDNSPLPSKSDPSLSGTGEGPADFANRWAPSPHTKTAINGVDAVGFQPRFSLPTGVFTHRAGEALNGVCAVGLALAARRCVHAPTPRSARRRGTVGLGARRARSFVRYSWFPQLRIIRGFKMAAVRRLLEWLQTAPCSPLGSELSDRADEPSSRRLSLNRSQYGGCSTKYNTPAGT